MVLKQLLWYMGVSKGFLEKVTSDSKSQEEQELARQISMKRKKRDCGKRNKMSKFLRSRKPRICYHEFRKCDRYYYAGGIELLKVTSRINRTKINL